MDTGDKIKIFPDTDTFSYMKMIHDAGFNCQVFKNKYILIKERRRLEFEDKREIGRKITEAMKEKGLSREDLAKAIGTKKDTVWNWQIGRSTPNEKNREKLRKLGFEL